MRKPTESGWLVCEQVGFATPTGRTLFHALSLSVGREKVGVIGRNGIGKSTLLRILAGALLPTAGMVHRRVGVALVPQQLGEWDPELRLEQFLGMERVLALIAAAERGDADDSVCELSAEDWDLPRRAKRVLADLGLSGVSWERPLGTLSGGERRRLAIARAALSPVEFLLLDEPANDLDCEGRAHLRRFLASWQGGFLLVSHEQDLLEDVSAILELAERGATVYSGNIDAFLAAKSAEENAVITAAQFGLQKLSQLERQYAELVAGQERRTRIAEDKAPDAGINRTLVQVLKERAQGTAVRIEAAGVRKRQALEHRIEELRKTLVLHNQVEVSLPGTEVALDEPVLEARNLTVQYGERALFSAFNLSLVGPVRLGIMGPNGSGKTTLLRTLAGATHPQAGGVNVRLPMGFLEQNSTGFSAELTLLENLRRATGRVDDDALLTLLQMLGFPSSLALRSMDTLSGGEMRRAALARLLAATVPPRLLLLDEPTNSLDFDALRSLERALVAFRGALLVVSHDLAFLRNVGVSHLISSQTWQPVSMEQLDESPDLSALVTPARRHH